MSYNKLMMRPHDTAGKFATRAALTALALAAVVLMASSGTEAPSSGSQAIQFRYECNGQACALVITGLPDPLGAEVTVKLSSAASTPELVYAAVSGDTVVASETPITDVSAPALVRRVTSPPPPQPPAVSLDVPNPPPRSL